VRSTVFGPLLALAAVTLGGTPALASGPRPPNVVLVLADDLGWADLGSYGSRFNETPRLDRLAAEGVRFTDFYAAAPVCSPTRAALMTGLHPARLGLTAHIPGHWRPFERLAEPPTAMGLPAGVPTLPERLKARGYVTAHFGKWHLGWQGRPSPADAGFDESFEIGGHDVPPERRDPPGAGAARSAEALARRAVRFLEAHRDRPVFVYLAPNAVHIPLTATPERLAKFRAKPAVPGYPSLPVYAALLEELDASVGLVLDALDRLGLARDTVVVFTSDNGGLVRESGGWPATGNAPLRDEKGTVYEGGIRVPTIVRWTGVVPPGLSTATPAVTTDLVPTLLEIAGVPYERGSFDGESLVGVLREPARPVPARRLFWHYPHYHHGRPAAAVREGRHKLVEHFDTGAVELYDLEADVSESRDLAASEPDRARGLLEALRAFRRETGAAMPRDNPAHDPGRAGEWWSRITIAPTEAPGTPRPGEPDLR
jgi:uncharacterized sulfatase